MPGWSLVMCAVLVSVWRDCVRVLVGWMFTRRGALTRVDCEMLTEMFTDGYLNNNLPLLQLVNEPRIFTQFSVTEQAKLQVCLCACVCMVFTHGMPARHEMTL